MKQIKNIIFDLGGVFLNIDYPKTQIAFETLGVSDFHDLFTQHHASPLFENLEVGKISSSEFYDEFRSLSKTDLSNEQIEMAWNAMLLDFPKERLDWLEKIKLRYHIFLFSNTNQIHYDAFMKIYRDNFGADNFNDHFIKAYYSQNIGLRKPYPESFEYILAEQQLDRSETLFIDDTLKNIEGANKIGLQTMHLAAPKTILDLHL
jgi:putative hydrolase of the HAD superfamily